jgi:hypothetical protein
VVSLCLSVIVFDVSVRVDDSVLDVGSVVGTTGCEARIAWCSISRGSRYRQRRRQPLFIIDDVYDPLNPLPDLKPSFLMSRYDSASLTESETSAGVYPR